MINVEQFEAKVVRDAETRDTKGGPVCNLRVRQIDPGKSSVFLDVATFDGDLIETCGKLAKGMIVKLTGGLIYSEWETKSKGNAKPQKRSKHSLLASSVEIVSEAGTVAS